MVDPKYFLLSFIAVVVHYVVLFTGLLASMLVLARVGWPDVFAKWNMPNEQSEEFKRLWETTPEVFFPTGLCIALVIVSLMLGVALGVSAAWWAPFAGAGHGVFLAVLTIVTFLQIAMTQPQLPKWMMAAMLVVCPIGIFFGARFGEARFGKRRQWEDDPSLSDSGPDGTDGGED